MSELPHQAFAGSKIIVMCAPNGARRGVEDHPAIPLTPASMARNAKSLVDAGVSVLHLHVRDERGRHTLDVDQYRTSIEAVRQAVGNRLVVQVTTESCGIYRREEQMQLVRDLRPEAVSVALRELCPDEAAETEAARFYAWMDGARIMAQHILYSHEESSRFAALRRRGLIPGARPFVLLVLGRYTSDLTGNPAELEGFLDCLPDDAEWAVCCFGKTEQEAAGAAAEMGGHARVGFENNLYLPGGGIAPDNAALVAAAAAACRDAGRTIATADEVRALFS